MIGQELGNYRVLAPIGKGGMASVFVGEHKLLGSQVAIKVLQERHLDNVAIERRFFNEAKVIAAIKHSNIVEIYDFGRADNGCAYIVMELLEGETLRERIRQGVMPERQSIIFAKQLAAALAAAHREGVIHRDLKPDNVFIIRDEEVELGERIKLLDFGIAKRLQSLGPASEQTATGILVGTPAYMSPEQCKGLGDIDGRSDIYSLGVVLYRMVTNQLPFEAGGTGELIGKHLYIQAPPARELNPQISATLDSIITRCLKKEPEERFQTMSDLATALAEANAAARLDLEMLEPDTLTGVEDIAPIGEIDADTDITAAPAGEERITSPVPVPEISTTTLRSITGEKVSPLAEERTRRGWMLYAGVGCAVALLAGVIALNTGSSDPTRPASSSVVESDGGDSDITTAAAVAPEPEVGAPVEPVELVDEVEVEAAPSAGDSQPEPEPAIDAAAEARAREAAAAEAARREAERRAEIEAAAAAARARAEAKKRETRRAEREAKQREAEAAARREKEREAQRQRAEKARAARAAAEARAKAKAERDKKKKKSSVPLHY